MDRPWNHPGAGGGGGGYVEKGLAHPRRNLGADVAVGG